MGIKITTDEASSMSAGANDMAEVTVAPMSGLVQGTLVGSVVAVAAAALTSTAVYAYNTVKEEEKPAAATTPEAAAAAQVAAFKAAVDAAIAAENRG